ncbi:MAG: MaoC family dehydratase [Chloroflexi bacterium]|nr:MaoC family dehydratase [Chloroflexota bacterium]
MTKATVLAELGNQLGQEVHVSEWLTITQAMVDQFAAVTRDQQWIHVDPVRAQGESPFGATVAHGYFTLSLIPYLTDSVNAQVDRYPGKKLGVNYGLNKVRFPHPVLVGARIRAHTSLLQVEEIQDALQIINLVTIEIEGQFKPACVAETVSRVYF